MVWAPPQPPLEQHLGPRAGTAPRVVASNTAQHGGVGAISKRFIHEAQFDHPDLDFLRSSRRRLEVSVPVHTRGGRLGCHAATIYGVPGAAADRSLYLENEAILRAALDVAARVGDSPYVISVDLNTDCEHSKVVASALRPGHWHSAASLACSDEDPGQPTFSHGRRGCPRAPRPRARCHSRRRPPV